MLKKGAVWFLLFLTIFLAGCETAKGVAGGMAIGATEGAKKDWAALQKVDAWMRKNLW